MPLVFDELRNWQPRSWPTGSPAYAQATALVHEAYLRLVGIGEEPRLLRNRGHVLENCTHETGWRQ